MASLDHSWTETCSCCGYSANFYKYTCGCITRFNVDKYKKPCPDCDTFTERYDCGQGGDREDHEGPGERRDRIERERREAERERSYYNERQETYSRPSGSVENALFQLAGKLIGVLILIFIIGWLISNVVLPLLIMDIAIIALAIGHFNPKIRQYALVVSILGAVLFIFDYNLGWSSLRFKSNVTFLAGLVPILYILNICAGIFACYMLISDYLKTSKSALFEQPTKKNLIIGGHVLLGIMVLGFQFIQNDTKHHVTYQTVKTQNPSPQNTPVNPTPKQEAIAPSAEAVTSNPPASFQPFYILNVAAYKTEEQAKNRVANLTNSGKSAGYLWIPDYPSLSGAQLYCVYLGPYQTQNECEIATEEYRKKYPGAYGLLVSKEQKRVQINGIGKVVTKNNSNTSCENQNGSGETALITGDNVRVRTEPNSQDDSNIVQRVNKGNLAKVLDRTTNPSGETWFKICYDGQIGWVIGSYISIQ